MIFKDRGNDNGEGDFCDNNADCNDDSVEDGNLQVQVWLLQSLPELLCGHLASLPSTLRHLQGKLFITGWPFPLHFGRTIFKAKLPPVAGGGEARSVRRRRRC